MVSVFGSADIYPVAYTVLSARAADAVLGNLHHNMMEVGVCWVAAAAIELFAYTAFWQVSLVWEFRGDLHRFARKLVVVFYSGMV